MRKKGKNMRGKGNDKMGKKGKKVRKKGNDKQLFYKKVKL